MKLDIFSAAVTAIIGCFFVPALLAEELILRPETTDDFGSGASTRQDYYLPGDEVKGMIIGHPNPITRGDRALLRINLESLLLKASRINKAEFVIYFDSLYVQDPEETRHILIERMDDDSLPLSGAVISSRDAEPVAEYDVKSDDLITPSGVPGYALSSPPDPLRVDVTEIIKTKLKEGASSIVFRISDTKSEAQLNDTGGTVGVLIPTRPDVIPHLQVNILD